MEKDRFFEEYFFVHFLGKGFPKAFEVPSPFIFIFFTFSISLLIPLSLFLLLILLSQGKQFIVRGVELEKLGHLITRLKKRFPKAEVIPQTDNIDISSGLCISSLCLLFILSCYNVVLISNKTSSCARANPQHSLPLSFSAQRQRYLPSSSRNIPQSCASTLSPMRLMFSIILGLFASALRDLKTSTMYAISSHLISSHLISSHLTSPHLTSPHLTSPHLTSPHLTSPHLTSPHLTSPHLSSPLIFAYIFSPLFCFIGFVDFPNVSDIKVFFPNDPPVLRSSGNIRGK